ncbi:MAG: hypothetical protein ACKVPY_18140 [Paracoccaceae bacterium]
MPEQRPRSPTPVNRSAKARSRLALLAPLLILNACGQPDSAQDRASADHSPDNAPRASAAQDLAAAIKRQTILATELEGGYELTGSEVYTSDVPEKPAKAGVVAVAGYSLSGPPGAYTFIFVFYNIFDDPTKAGDYVMDFIAAPEGPTQYRTVPYRNAGHPELPQIGSGEDIPVTCAAEPQGDLTAKCGFLASGPHPVVVTMVLAPGPTAGIREPGESPIAAAFRDGQLTDRLNAVLPAAIDQLRSAL